jgi:hypothetical protein
MKIFPVCFFLLFFPYVVFAQSGVGNKLPEIWPPDFKISLSHSGSMRGGSTSLTFTRDTCKYTFASERKAPRTKVYKMKETDRAAILKKLTELNVDAIKSEFAAKIVYDGWSESICFGMHCVEAGPAAEISDHDKDIFMTAYKYLEEFAVSKTK